MTTLLAAALLIIVASNAIASSFEKSANVGTQLNGAGSLSTGVSSPAANFVPMAISSLVPYHDGIGPKLDSSTFLAYVEPHLSTFYEFSGGGNRAHRRNLKVSSNAPTQLTKKTARFCNLSPEPQVLSV